MSEPSSPQAAAAESRTVPVQERAGLAPSQTLVNVGYAPHRPRRRRRRTTPTSTRRGSRSTRCAALVPVLEPRARRPSR